MAALPRVRPPLIDPRLIHRFGAESGPATGQTRRPEAVANGHHRAVDQHPNLRDGRSTGHDPNFPKLMVWAAEYSSEVQQRQQPRAYAGRPPWTSDPGEVRRRSSSAEFASRGSVGVGLAACPGQQRATTDRREATCWVPRWADKIAPTPLPDDLVLAFLVRRLGQHVPHSSISREASALAILSGTSAPTSPAKVCRYARSAAVQGCSPVATVGAHRKPPGISGVIEAGIDRLPEDQIDRGRQRNREARPLLADEQRTYRSGSSAAMLQDRARSQSPPVSTDRRWLVVSRA